MVDLRLGDCLELMRELPDESVHCIVTSPPYWALRDYGCEGQIGLEASPEEYIAKMVAVFREARRVLRHDGTCWVNLGDCYAASGCGCDTGKSGLQGTTESQDESKAAKSNRSFRRDRAEVGNVKHIPGAGLRPKNLMGIPWRVALALQADGWFLRCDIIWDKPNPMPESVDDRPTKSHEYIFLLTKSARYFYDAEAIREPVSGTANARGDGLNPKAKTPGQNSRLFQDRDPKHSSARKVKQNESFSSATCGLVSSRNKRSVWRVPTEPCKEAHFATFPTELIKPCILAGTSAAGCCAQCGRSLERVIEKGAPDEAHRKACGADAAGGYNGKATKDFKLAGAQNASEVKARIIEGMRERRTVDWKASCECRAGTVPCVVLDPFGGSGTTGQVSIELGRRAVLIELNPEYVKIIEGRCNVTPGLAV